MSTTHTEAHDAYVRSSVATASPGRLLVMLYDRLVLDIERGLRAQMKGDNTEAHHQLTHAQSCISELQSSLVVEGWEAGPKLASLYDYLQRRLIVANIKHDQRATKEALVHCRALRDTWREAALRAAAEEGRR